MFHCLGARRSTIGPGDRPKLDQADPEEFRAEPGKLEVLCAQIARHVLDLNGEVFSNFSLKVINGFYSSSLSRT